jgi:glycosyltransferase involved in cell wall biosynthesis
MTIYVDHTHLGRHVTGLERITLELFSPDALSPLDIRPLVARGTAPMMMAQTFGLPRRMLTSSALLLCPGFPPSPLLLPFAKRVIPYIHDVFLMSRPQDLNIRARLYMARPFALAVRKYPRFLVNSADTRKKLAALCRSDAEIHLYRPSVRNVFDVKPAAHDDPVSPLRLISLGTIEPRKNFRAAAGILTAIRNMGFPDATLELIGRPGWGDDWDALKSEPGVVLSGYRPVDYVRQQLQGADAFICTSHDEGLGLPLLEAQYAGLPIIAPDDSIFHEVLGDSGIFIDRADHAAAARAIIAAITQSGWRNRYRELAARNLLRWNETANDDRNNVIAMLSQLARDSSRDSRSDADLGPMEANRRGTQLSK